MESWKSRLIVPAGLLVLLFLITGCAGGFVASESAAITDSTVSATMRFVDGPHEGLPYNVTVNVPEEWVGQFEVRNIGNRLYFDYVGEAADAPAQIFFIEALSPAQYWEQIAGYPGSYANIVNKGDTFFIYYLPIDSYYSGLAEADFITFSEAVPDIIASFMAEAQ